MTGAITTTRPGPKAGQGRLSMSDKHAIVQQLRRMGAGKAPLGCHVRAVAEQHGVALRSVYRWLADAAFAADATPSPTGRTRFEITDNHLAVVADEQSYWGAWERLQQHGMIDCSYATFARALRERTSPELVQSALHGYHGLVNNRVYLSWTPPHRNYVFHLDHTKMDLWVLADHRTTRPVRPHVTVIVDGYSGLIHAVPWFTSVNGDMVAAALAETMVERDYYDVQVGGQPVQIILDNAAEHFGPAMRAGVAALGLVIAPTGGYAGWQNGKAERAIGLINKRFSNRAPGATNAGNTRTGASRHHAKDPDKIDPESIWSAKAFQQALQEVVDEINLTIKMKRHGGLTRLEAYAADTTERRPLPAASARKAMLTTGDKTRRVNKNGLPFKSRNFVGDFLEYGRDYVIRYLPTNLDFVEVFDLHGEHLGRADWDERVSRETRAKMMQRRAEQERRANAIEAGVQAKRRHLAELRNAEAAAAGDDEDILVTPGQTGLLADVTRLPDPRPSRRSPSKPLRRVPAKTTQRAAREQVARTSSNNRLAAVVGDDLPIGRVPHEGEDE